MPRAYNLSEMNVEGLIQGLGSRREAFAAQADEEFGAGNWSLVWAINTLTRIDDQDHQHWELRLYPKEAVLHLYEDGYYHLFLDNLDVARVLCETARDVFEVDELDCQAGTDWSAQEAGHETFK